MTTRMNQLTAEVIGVIQRYMTERGLKTSDVVLAPDVRLDSFGFDSIDKAAILVELENYFDLSFERAEAFSMTSAEELVAMIARTQDAMAP